MEDKIKIFENLDDQFANAPWSKEIQLGDNTRNFINSFLSKAPNPDKAKNTLATETKAILKKCGDPSLDEFKVNGLVYGYIQSGKTASFTTLSSLAQENGYQIIIILGGISTNLVSQTHARLKKGLQTERSSNWLTFSNPTTEDQNKIKFAANSNRRTVMITVMKNKTHLENLIEIFKGIDSSKVATLIIDDEADQASLNNEEFANQKRVARGDEEAKPSTIFRLIQGLINCFKKSSVVQYTATPQANLFLDNTNPYKPQFVQMISAGEEYTGGDFLIKQRGEFIVKDIPLTDMNSEIMPQTLIDAFRTFLLTVSEGLLRRNEDRFAENEPDRRSMMINPTHLNAGHQQYFNWIKQRFDIFAEVVADTSDEASFNEFKEEYLPFYEDLAKEIPDIHEFDELFNRDQLADVICDTTIQKVNSDQTEVDWDKSYAWILIGGNSLSRGYTVDGLTVTWMTRPSGNFDTFMQRARFYGYKYHYANFCRIYLDKETSIKFKKAVDDEEYLRFFLRENNNISLEEMRLKLMNSANFDNVTRKVVLRNPIRNIRISDWNRIENITSTDSKTISQNINNYEYFYNEKLGSLTKDTSFTYESDIKPKFIEISVKKLMNELLYKIRLNDEKYSFLLKMLENQEPALKTKVYFMSDFNDFRKRTIQPNGRISLFQGRSERIGGYPGDPYIRDQKEISVQLHRLKLFQNHNDLENNTNGVDSFSLAAWIPSSLSTRFYFQDN